MTWKELYSPEEGLKPTIGKDLYVSSELTFQLSSSTADHPRRTQGTRKPPDYSCTWSVSQGLRSSLGHGSRCTACCNSATGRQLIRHQETGRLRSRQDIRHSWLVYPIHCESQSCHAATLAARLELGQAGAARHRRHLENLEESATLAHKAPHASLLLPSIQDST